MQEAEGKFSVGKTAAALQEVGQSLSGDAEVTSEACLRAPRTQGSAEQRGADIPHR
jgi:hypothetical protein